jgi:hypothetical protein
MAKRVYILVVLFFFSCDQTITSYKPKSSGNIHTVSVVAEDKVWNSKLGDNLREVFASEFEGLPQQEPLFTLVHIPPKIFKDFAREGRNIIKISPNTVDTAYIEKNKYASPQLVLNIEGPNTKTITKQLNKISSKAVLAFRNSEVIEKQRRIRKSVLKTEEFKALGVNLTLPSAYSLFKKDDQNKLWFQRETKKGSVNFLTYTLPITSQPITLEKVIKIRDSIGKDFVPGRNEGSYVITEKAYEPYFNKIKIKKFTAFKTKGTWEVVNDYMAGPFLNIIIEDAKNQRYVVFEGFVFSPSDRKREYMVEIEAIIKSLKIL